MSDMRHSHNQSDLNTSCADEIRIELLKLHKSELIIKILKLSGCPISVENRALLSIYQYDGSLPFGLENIRNVETGYHEKLSLTRFIETNILDMARPIIHNALKLTDNNLNALGVSVYKDYVNVLELEAEKRKLTEMLIKLKNRKLHFMNLCAEMRTGPYQKNNIETKNAESKALQIKAETIQRVMIHEVITSTAHAEKAVKEVETNIDALLSLK
ncbi:uncharacterized protein LOC131431371 [Malaya genurostris]|uniref:uncharacterized protein LOC131431371 n=1 Tax=Malaya genurostris TaxID=325434 RepID=UPI0026F3F253|nr:uncharacterized protein LOC131431371 [Malaya genurostris]XP_058453030.1 uncharacterized protein LOC131431371 [Malaya genurostris]XP_058453031.1 uncharacterized protein LOC131431371 [Malaya genurostris]